LENGIQLSGANKIWQNTELIQFFEQKLQNIPIIEFDLQDVLGIGGESIVYKRKLNGADCAFKIAPYDEISNDEKATVQNLHSNPTVPSNSNTPPNPVSQANTAPPPRKKAKVQTVTTIQSNYSQLLRSTSGNSIPSNPNTPPIVTNSGSQSNSTNQLLQLNTATSPNLITPSNSATPPPSVANTIPGRNSSSHLNQSQDVSDIWPNLLYLFTDDSEAFSSSRHSPPPPTIDENDVNVEYLNILDETSESVVTLLKHENVIDYSVLTIDIVHGVFAFITGKKINRKSKFFQFFSTDFLKILTISN